MTRHWIARASTNPFSDILNREGPMVDLLVGQYYHWQGTERFDAVKEITADGVTLHTEEVQEGVGVQSGPIRLPLALAEKLHEALNSYFQQPAPPSVDALQEALAVERARVDKVMDNLLIIVNQEMP
jgi:hypothetical protein